MKNVLGVERVRLSHYKEANPTDSDAVQDIGLSSEDEAEDLPEVPTVRRKYHATSAPDPPPQPQHRSSTQPSTEPAAATASIQVPVEMLQQVHHVIGQLIAGQPPSSLSGMPSASVSEPTEEVPFSIPKPKQGEKNCTICLRKFWSTETLKRHMKVHTGEQKYICPNADCKRKLVSKRSFENHLLTCGKERRVWCPKKGCKKYFVSDAGLKAHSTTHRKLKKTADKCPCGQTFTKLKSKNDHWRTCDANPNKVGPFPCPVAGCHRGPIRPFRRVRNLNLHLKTAHKHDPKHGR